MLTVILLLQLLLVTWKVLLACLGGMAEQARAKTLARELAGLPPLADNRRSHVIPVHKSLDCPVFLYSP